MLELIESAIAMVPEDGSARREAPVRRSYEHGVSSGSPRRESVVGVTLARRLAELAVRLGRLPGRAVTRARNWCRPDLRLYRAASGEETLTLAVAPADTFTVSVVRTFCGRVTAAEDLGPCWRWTLQETARAHGADLLVVRRAQPSSGTPLRGLPEFYLPDWVVTEQPLAADGPPGARKSLLQAVRSRVRRHRLELEVSRTEESFRQFYEEMYSPLLKQRFGSRAEWLSLGDMMRRYHELLFVTQDGVRLAGATVRFERDRAVSGQYGRRENLAHHLHECVLDALKFHTCAYLARRGIRRHGVGGSRPFVNDGALRSKIRWGSELQAGSRHGVVLRILRDSRGLRRALELNPLLHLAGGGVRVAFFISCLPTEKALRQSIGRAGLPGVRGVDLHGVFEPGKADDFARTVGRLLAGRGTPVPVRLHPWPLAGHCDGG
ncbi:MAG: hypothetical protein HY814_07730 [Candidatus Riflebacteria bacterium]|nr:hypothetical protein [Candidatus Riflebacteria bacterium]